MARPRFGRTLVPVIGAMACWAAPVVAQVPQMPRLPPALPEKVPDSVRQMLAEMQQVHLQLAEIQAQTLEANADLQEERRLAQEAVEAAMREADPQLDHTLERLAALATELHYARARQDTARMRQIVLEGQRMQRALHAAQTRAAQREDVAERIRAYQDRLLAAMKAHDPRTEQLIARLESLAARLEAAAPR